MEAGFAGDVGLDVQVMAAGAVGDSVALPAPTLEQVLARGAVLTAVAYRGWSEARDRALPERQETRLRLLRWLDHLGLMGQAEHHELVFLVGDVGAVSYQEAMGAAWRVEGAAVMAWAARLMEMPAYHELAQLPPLMELMDDAPHGRVEAGPVRSEEDVVQLMHTSIGVLEVMDRLGGLSGAEWLHPSASLEFERRGLPLHRQQLAEGNLISRTAFERAKATRWLMGLSSKYGATPVPLKESGRQLV